VLCRKDETLQELSTDLSQRNVEYPFSRKQFVSGINSRDSTPGLYQPLPSGHIRILELLLGHCGDGIQCRLHDTALEQNEFAYDALSYTWELSEYVLWHEASHGGKNRKTTESPGVLFTFRGLKVPVQENLRNALLRMRDSQGGSYLWVSSFRWHMKKTCKIIANDVLRHAG
jgi:hypothetical protein